MYNSASDTLNVRLLGINARQRNAFISDKQYFIPYFLKITHLLALIRLTFWGNSFVLWGEPPSRQSVDG